MARPGMTESAVKYLTHLELGLSRAIENLVTFFFLLIFGLTVIMVALRYGFNSSITGGNEAMNYLFIYTTALGAAVSIGRGTHIRISFFTDLLPSSAKRVVAVVNYLLVGFFNALMVWYSAPWIKSTGMFESPVMRIPNWVIQASVPLGCALATLYCLNHILLELSGEKQADTVKA